MTVLVSYDAWVNAIPPEAGWEKRTDVDISVHKAE